MADERNHNLFSTDYRIVYRSSYDGIPLGMHFSETVMDYFQRVEQNHRHQMEDVLLSTPLFKIKYKECSFFKKLRDGEITFCNCIGCKRLSEDRKGFMLK